MTASGNPATRASSYVGLAPVTGRRTEVIVQDSVITAVHTGEVATGLPWIAPGLIDLQVNGFAGHDLNGPDASPDAVIAVTAALARVGTTSYVPTIITDAEPAMTRAVRAVAEARRIDPATRHAVPFLHLEGPCISPQDGARGVHPAEQVRPPDLAEFARIQHAADGLVGMVTLSPHHPEAAAFTEALCADGVRVAIGHTHATPEQIRSVIDAGAAFSTHLGNGAHATLARHPNYIWTQLAADALTAGFIADGHHLSDDTLTAMLRAKGVDRSVLVSDSVALAGMEPGTYRTPVGGLVEMSATGRLAEVGTSYLAGAARPLLAGVDTVSALDGFTLADALQLATANPGQLLPDRGRLTTAASADLVLLDPTPAGLRPRLVLAAGREITVPDAGRGVAGDTAADDPAAR